MRPFSIRQSASAPITPRFSFVRQLYRPVNSPYRDGVHTVSEQCPSVNVIPSRTKVAPMFVGDRYLGMVTIGQISAALLR